ncbi:hypothetical protein FT663_01881 [Candidozyma haemuli var. vulneris]|uniref:Cell division control protein 73 C-terminal domain-containing protein n=1 Tax=Candidozyma haemuli TaxID=45357 RepID=A0A2V1APK4_9ASCO|nr:hypothetical protein CXQ85_003312 [[Candida] haemuloni]KAF3993377.1 hypothetical protein FT663_01881 [[Candida] haemuloni var. vulneris]KAF3993834.1 hypothetical protein FT662_00282 [[Candida] haemuloni var. vulneris]PVH19466.1 hypothetical protein CXQ85_003312 [[Candida] haemuloni]
MDSIKQLRKATVGKKPIELFKDGEKTENIKEATHASLGDDQKYGLDELTNFYNEDQRQSLRAVIFCWMHDKSSIVDYKNACLENGIPDFKFLVKAELTTWLSGSSDACQFVKEDESSSKAGGADADGNDKKRKLEDPQMARIESYQEDSVDHNSALRGSKNIVFKNLISDAKRFASQLKRSKSSRPSSANGAGAAANKKSPIIIISPATTALLSLANIKEFLEESRFVEPNVSTMKRPESGVVTINHPSDKLAPSAHSIMVVDNVDMFTKPEYWDRVVAIFTTGQAWQFSKYKYSKPEVLFQKYPGFFVAYQNDVVPKQIKDWNVNVVRIDRGEKRFRDKMIVRDLWIHLEKILIGRQYGAQE